VVENLYKEQESLDKDLFVMFELFRNRVHGHTARYLSSKILSYSGEERPYLSPSRLFTSTTSLNSPAREFLVRLLRPAAGRGGKAGDRLHLANRLLVNEINVDILNAAASEGILAEFEDDGFQESAKVFRKHGRRPHHYGPCVGLSRYGLRLQAFSGAALSVVATQCHVSGMVS
jgi:hypothetical protein